MPDKPEVSYGPAFSTIFDCAMFIGKEVNQPFQNFGKTYEKLKKDTREDVIHNVFDRPEMKKAVEEIKETARGMVGKFNAENAARVVPYAFPIMTSSPHKDYSARFCCQTKMPEPIKMESETVLFYPSGNPSIKIEGERRVEKKPSEILNALANLKGIGITEFFVEPKYSEREVPLTLPVKAFCGRRLSRILDASEVKIELQRQRTPNFKSTVEFHPEESLEVEIEYYDDGKLFGKKMDEIAKEKQWLVQVVSTLTNSS